MLSEQAAAARREYKRQWARRNPEKVQAQQERYWNKRAQAEQNQAQQVEAQPAPAEDAQQPADGSA